MTASEKDQSNRWSILIPCMTAMLAIANLQYAWTFFTTDITKALHVRLDTVQWTLTFFIIAQTALFPINAYLIDRFGPRLIVTLASLLVAVGWVGAGWVNSLSALYLVYAIGGIGAGAVYGGCVGVAMKWFPDRRGLCVGLVAGSYGFGTALTIRPVAYLIEHSGYRTTFIVFGALQGFVVLLSAQFLRMPPPGWLPSGWETIKAKIQQKVQQSSRDYTPKEMVRSGSFHLLYLMMTLVTASGLMLTAHLKPIGVTYGYDKYALFAGYTVLTLTSSLNQVLNGSARPFFGWVSDRIGRYDTMAIVFVMEAVTITLLTLVVAHPFWFIVVSGLMFFAWGDIYSLFPAAIADIFGAKHATTNYGIQYTSKGIGSILGGPAAAWLMSAANSWIPVFWSAVACNVIAAALAVLWLKPRVARLVREQQLERDTIKTVTQSSLQDAESVRG
ncbi:MAG TPA: oxalate/formate MFS antiporter [Pyrinomonadaceae bacterium]|nr:oxalate/formate MFS antiporter [Pyrinomonadaceae bacterium]